MKLSPHQKYNVRGMEMFFLGLREDGTPEFYHYKYYGPTRILINFWDRDLKAKEIEQINNPIIMKKEIISLSSG